MNVFALLLVSYIAKATKRNPWCPIIKGQAVSKVVCQTVQPLLLSPNLLIFVSES